MPLIIGPYAGSEKGGVLTVNVIVATTDTAKVHMSDDQTWKKSLFGNTSFHQQWSSAVALSFPNLGVEKLLKPYPSVQMSWSSYEDLRKDVNRSWKFDQAWTVALSNMQVKSTSPPTVQILPGARNVGDNIFDQKETTEFVKKTGDKAKSAYKATKKAIGDAWRKSVPDVKEGLAKALRMFAIFLVIVIVLLFAVWRLT